jgi:hypothetical protein
MYLVLEKSVKITYELTGFCRRLFSIKTKVTNQGRCQVVPLSAPLQCSDTLHGNYTHYLQKLMFEQAFK